MAHSQQMHFMSTVKDKFYKNFKNCNVLDVGSLNINGSTSILFEGGQYTGIELGEGPGVDIVCEAQKYDAPDNHFDTIVSCECFEHNPFWVETFRNMYRMCKPNGLIIMTCATTGRPVHGTSTINPESAPHLINFGWENYYKNLAEEDFKENFNISSMFSDFEFSVDDTSKDLYFWGIKKENKTHSLYDVKTNTDKFDLGYVDEFYDKLLSNRKISTKSVLEIGVDRGESILLWDNFFENAKIIGMDILKREGIRIGNRSLIIEEVNAYSEYALELVKKINPDGFDLIIDDGPHTFDSMTFFLTHYSDLLSDDGILVLEDIIQTSWTPKLYDILKEKGGNIKLIDMRYKAKKQHLIETWKYGLDVLIYSKNGELF
jgi:2-polyprenyl-3-methyl-5-hydroxy-6-metoxy-1,4-benzoquinol methylase